MRAHLTDVSVRSLKPTEKQTKVWDLRTPGFGIRINGRTKSWFVMYGTRRTLKALGRYPDVSLSDARKQAMTYLGGAAEEPARKVRLTFSDVLPDYLDEHFRDLRPRTAKEAKRQLEKHFQPTLGDKGLPSITDGDISGILDGLADRPSEQLHAFRALRTFLRWCTRPPRRYIAHSPLEGFQAPGKDRKGTRILTDDELVAIWKACTGPGGDFVRLCILWGSRTTETVHIRPAWVEDSVLVIPGTHTKNHRAHAIPLEPMALEILKRQPEADRYFSIAGWSALKKQIDEKSGVKNWQLNRDIRRTFRSNMPKLKVPRHISEMLLNHIKGGERNELDEIYDRYDYLEEKRDALSKWEAKITALLARA
jgi:integrase